MARMTPLRRRLIDDMTVRNLSPATQQSYVYAVAKFSRFFGRSPDQLGVGEVRAYQIHLVGLRLSWSHINQVSCALRFFFGVTLGRQDAIAHIVRAKEPKKLPVVLSAEEIARFLEAVPGLRSRAALTTAYGAGLRVSEVVATGAFPSTSTAWPKGKLAINVSGCITGSRRRFNAVALTCSVVKLVSNPEFHRRNSDQEPTSTAWDRRLYALHVRSCPALQSIKAESAV